MPGCWHTSVTRKHDTHLTPRRNSHLNSTHFYTSLPFEKRKRWHFLWSVFNWITRTHEYEHRHSFICNQSNLNIEPWKDACIPGNYISCWVQPPDLTFIFSFLSLSLFFFQHLKQNWSEPFICYFFATVTDALIWSFINFRVLLLETSRKHIENYLLNFIPIRTKKRGRKNNSER